MSWPVVPTPNPMSSDRERISEFDAADERFMAASLRYARRNEGLTGTNPSVGTLLVKGGVVQGRGVTAVGGRPHAETVAIAQAGTRAQGSTAYVTLEPCAHHGVTPPCAQALIDAGVKRVVTAWVDPDQRVDGKGHKRLRDAGIQVSTGLCAQQAERNLSAYLTRKSHSRTKVTLKLAVSADGKLGLSGQEVAITGERSRSFVHALRARSDAILIGISTALTDDPDLTCRLPGLEGRSPHRVVLDSKARLPVSSRLAQSAARCPVFVASEAPLPSDLSSLGVRRIAAEEHDGRLALPEILEDLAGLGYSSVLVEGGGTVAQSFLVAQLVDDIILLVGHENLGPNGLTSPLHPDEVPRGFQVVRRMTFENDTCIMMERC